MYAKLVDSLYDQRNEIEFRIKIKAEGGHERTFPFIQIIDIGTRKSWNDAFDYLWSIGGEMPQIEDVRQAIADKALKTTYIESQH